MTPKQLLQECETLTYNGRMRRMVELGRLASSDASIGNTLSAFMQGNVYQRILAVQSCYGSRDSALVLRALSDPSRSVRALALNLVARLFCERPTHNCRLGGFDEAPKSWKFDMPAYSG